ncbi:MAG: V-type ATP synthase subunit D [Candidatus Omnitrophica bacterium]|nr:V-type ATP synthase subunit D [Candidatus Omnitrophota bacterium]
MGKIKLTKGELKKERDALRRYERYLPILQLKKQQLQIEILRQAALLEEKRRHESETIKNIETWGGLLTDRAVNIRQWLKLEKINIGSKNIAGTDLPIFEGVEFGFAEYDLFSTPLWVDTAVELLRALVSLREEIGILEKGIYILRHELRITTQRVNLFEKVKIPEAEEAIRVIKIYLGDQMSNAVGRSKIAKKKIEEAEEVVV